MQIRQLTIERFRGVEKFKLCPGPRTVILGPQNAGKSTVLEALDVLLHHGYGRRRPDPAEIDYFKRDPTTGFEIEAIVGGLSKEFTAEVAPHLEGWQSAGQTLVTETDGSGVEPVVRIRARGTAELTVEHEFAKPESDGEIFNPAKRIQLGWIFDGRTRDPTKQLGFYQGGLLDRLFADADLDPAIAELRAALDAGAAKTNTDSEVSTVLDGLGTDLRELGLVGTGGKPSLEAGPSSRRELLQALRLALPSLGVDVPLFRQGRGAQRLVLVSILLKIAQNASTRGVIGGFEEPEEALEPLRQAQMASMLFELADGGGQVFVVTHSPEVARRFEVDDFLLMPELEAGDAPRALRAEISPPVRQTYERWLDGAVVRGLFSRVPILVEGPGDRAVFEAFWRTLVQSTKLRPAAELGIEVVNCEGNENMPMQATVLHQAGKQVVAWTERDNPQVNERHTTLMSEGHCALVASHNETENHQKLEGSLAQSGDLDGLIAALTSIATDRDYSWAEQREMLVSHAVDLSQEERDSCKEASDIDGLFGLLEEAQSRLLIAKALSAKGVTPFTIKGGRPARIFATELARTTGVPANFEGLLVAIQAWVESGCQAGSTFTMSDG